MRSLSYQGDLIWLIVPEVSNNCRTCCIVLSSLARRCDWILIQLLMLNLCFIPLLLVLMLLLNWNGRLRMSKVRILVIQLASLLEVRILIWSLGKVYSLLASTRCCRLTSLIILLLLLSTLLRHLDSNFFNLIRHWWPHKLLGKKPCGIRVEDSFLGECNIRLLGIAYQIKIL